MSGLTRADTEEYGFTPAVITTLGVSLLPGVGPATLRHIGDPENINELFAGDNMVAFTSALNATGAKFAPEGTSSQDWQQLRELIWRSGRVLVSDLIIKGIRCITKSSALYPNRLYDLGSRRPDWLFVRGNTSLLGVRSVAVVGTRNPTHTGDFLTRYAVSVCREFGFPVVSGLAKGIDSIAHEWSLKVSLPTISVLGSGLLVPYPARNSGLAEKIVSEGGLLVSEYLPHQQPSAETFVWRNRLQACIADCVIATEWKRSSGTAHTVRFANELKRPSVSASLLGEEQSVDAGRGSRHFVLPSEHAEFVAAIVGDHQSPDSSEGAINGYERSSDKADQQSIAGDRQLSAANTTSVKQSSLF